MNTDNRGASQSRKSGLPAIAVLVVYCFALAGFVGLLLAAAIAKGDANAFRYVGF